MSHDPPRDSQPCDYSQDMVDAIAQRHVRASDCSATPETVISDVADDLFDGDVEDIALDEAMVTQTLDGILTALIALRTSGTHGSGLMEDMVQLFDVQPSPGTVYPRLHELEAAGTLGRHELVQTKQYSISDEASAESVIEEAMYQHLSLGLFLSAARDAV